MTTTNPKEGIMSDTTPEAADGPQTDDQPTAGPDTPDVPNDPQEATEDQQDGKPGREAAKYRTRLREAQAELETARQQLEQARRTLVDNLAEQAGIKPAALWAGGTSIDGLLTEDGTIDVGLVRQAIDATVTTLGISRRPRLDPLQGVGNAVPTAPSFEAGFRPKR